MTVALSVIFLVSGASALLFETLWFRQAGLALGNSVWTSSLVTASFMGGLAIGNGLAARYGDRLRRPLLTYAKLEVLIGIAGLGLVFLFPILTPLMAPLLGTLLAHPAALNTVRLLAAFVLLLIPATAMGATLPLLVQTLTSGGMHFGRALGMLYGWNTLGAVAGALLGEMLLIGHLGIRGTGFVAAIFNCAAAAGALAVSRRVNAETPSDPPTQISAPLAFKERLLIAAAFLSGGTLLALEVVWFRFLLLFDIGTSVTFATMLAVVLLGIGGGGIVASQWLKWRSSAAEFLPLVTLAAGVVTAQTYATVSGFLPPMGSILLPAMYLMLATSLLSGILFTMLGSLLKDKGPGTTRTAGLLTLANTSGATAGALIGGFVLLPNAGMERSFLILSAGYGLIAVLIAIARWPSGQAGRHRLRAYALGGVVFAMLLALFPFGLMRNHYLPMVAAPFLNETSRIVAIREGLTETIIYVRQDLGGEPFFYRLITNSMSMSGTPISSKRYMGMFVYLPMAIQPKAKRALLISYGVGNTAKALTDTAALESIDVVDISRDVLEISQALLPNREDPLKDPRVNVHIEDGRFFLLTTKNSYDLITAEPPPPKASGIVNLYSREYFQLIHDRLSQGGVASYWLPVHQLSRHDGLAIIAAFCEAFDDCTLWSGYGAELMLVGTKEHREAITEEAFTRQWRDPVVSSNLSMVGFEEPEAIGATFIADAVQLREWTQGVPPVDDDHPHRLSPHPGREPEFFQSLQDSAAVRERYQQSDFIRTIWPAALRERTLDRFHQLDPVNRDAWTAFVGGSTGLPDLHAVLTSSRLRAPVLWMMGGTEDVQQIARRLVSRGIVDSSVQEIFGIAAMADRDYLEAERHFSQAQPYSQKPERVAQWRVLALCLAGRQEQAKTIIQEANRWFKSQDAAGWAWLSRTFSLPEIIDPATRTTIP